MTNQKDADTFFAFVMKKMTNKDQFIKTAQRQGVPWARSTILNWLNDKKCLPRSAAVPFCAALSSPMTMEEVDARWPNEKWLQESKREPKGKRKAAASTYRDCKAILEAIDDQHMSMDDGLEKIAVLSRLILKHGNSDSSLITISSGTQIQLFKPGKNDACKEQRDNRILAMKNGMLWLLIIPNKAYSHEMKKDYSIDKIEDGGQKLTANFDSFRKEFVAALGGGKEAEIRASQQMCIVEWHNFAFTPPGWTVSLFGMHVQPDNLEFRYIMRSPYKWEYRYQMMPANTEFTEDLKRYCENIINGQLTNDAIEEAKADFLRALKDRMRLR